MGRTKSSYDNQSKRATEREELDFKVLSFAQGQLKRRETDRQTETDTQTERERERERQRQTEHHA